MRQRGRTRHDKSGGGWNDEFLKMKEEGHELTHACGLQKLVSARTCILPRAATKDTALPTP